MDYAGGWGGAEFPVPVAVAARLEWGSPMTEAGMTVPTQSPAPFDGRHFHNGSGIGPHGFSAVLRWLLTRRRQPWPDAVAATIAAKPQDRVGDGAIRATVIGHATVLIQVAGLNILTDPVWSPRIGPVNWLGIKRIRPPAIAFDDLPRIDVVLVSHNHYDHLDRPTLAALAERDQVLVVTGRKAGHAVPGDLVRELDWWESRILGEGVQVTYVPAEHFSGRGPFDRNASLWGGFVLETPRGAIYFAGDTGMGPHFAAIRARFGPMTLSLLPIGAYAPRWFMGPVHLDPADAVAASVTLDSAISLALHFGTFRLADESYDAPLQELAAALAAWDSGKPGGDFRVPTFGEAVVI